MKLKDIGWKPFLPALISMGVTLLLWLIWTVLMEITITSQFTRKWGAYVFFTSGIIIPAIGFLWTTGIILFKIYTKLK